MTRIKWLLIGLLIAFTVSLPWTGPVIAQNVNTLVVRATATGSNAQLAATGSDTNIGIDYVPKGTGTHRFYGQLRYTQTTPPACKTSCGSVTGSDTLMRAFINYSGLKQNEVAVTFNGTWSATPGCSASIDGNNAYGYYITNVAATTTTATVSTGGSNGGGPQAGSTIVIRCDGVS